jgi:hypothetical protein
MPKASVSTPNPNRIAFGMLSVFAATMLEYERLERWRGRRPRASRRLAASVSVSPTSSICGPVAIG